MVHYLCRYQSVIDHPVVFHAIEAAVFGTAAELVLRQGTAQEGAHLLNGASQVLGKQNDTDKSPNQPKEWTSCWNCHFFWFCFWIDFLQFCRLEVSEVKRLSVAYYFGLGPLCCYLSLSLFFLCISQFSNKAHLSTQWRWAGWGSIQDFFFLRFRVQK